LTQWMTVKSLLHTLVQLIHSLGFQHYSANLATKMEYFHQTQSTE
jgi:hypothetical protein